MLSYRYSLKVIAVAFCLTSLVSCARREEVDTDMLSDTTATSTGDVQGGSASMTDGNIVAFMGAADSLEVVMGNMALTKAQNADVKKFAQAMVTEHLMMMKEGQAIAQRQGLMPIPSANDLMVADLASTISVMQSTSGAAFDSLYIASQVMVHERVLQNLNSINPMDTALRSLIGKVKPYVEQHLKDARRIQAQL